MPYAWIGQTAPLDNGVRMPLSRAVTFANVPDTYSPDEQMRAITDRVEDGAQMDGVQATHSAESPAWVESTDPEFAQKIADYYGCPVGRPDNWEQ